MPRAASSLDASPSVLRSVWLAVGVALVALAAAAATAQQAFALGGLYLMKVLGLGVPGGLGVAVLAGRALGAQGLGAANAVTLARAAVVALLAGLVGETPTPGLGWLAAGATLAVLVLDGLDGRLARRHGTASAFGARFDMETDALLGLVLAVLVVAFGKAGAFVLVAGLARYAFVALLVLAPRLDAPLAASRRRQAVCVAQIAGLAMCLVPWIARPASDVLAAAVVVAVVASFAVDVRMLTHLAAARTHAPRQ